MERTARNYDFTNVIKPEHAGKWIALNKEQTTIVAYADTFKELQPKIEKKDVVLMKVGRPGVSYAY
jgi:hypothetical protein